MALGNKIQEIRKNNNLTQEQFAQKFHITRQTVSNWENDRNYPDMSSLKMISDEYSVSFDELLKEDEKYIEAVDNTKKKMSTIRKVVIALITLLALLFTAVVGLCIAVHIAYQPTPDGKRINSDADIRMLVDLPTSKPSRAITYTTYKSSYNDDETKIAEYKSFVSKRVEGDIPCASIEDDRYITLHFQDLQYNDIYPERVKSLTCDLVDVTSEDRTPAKYSLQYNYKDGEILIEINPRMFKVNDRGEIWYTMVIMTEYEYNGESYSSFTALTVSNLKAGFDDSMGLS